MDKSDRAVSLGETVLLAECIKVMPYGVVDRALLVSNRSKRRLRKLPDHLMIYFCIFMAFFMESSYLHIFDRFKKNLGWLVNLENLADLTDSAIVQARQRLSSEPLRELFRLVAKPLSTSDTPGAFFRGLRLVVLDGTTFDVPDTPENSIFGRVINQSGKSATPLVRMVALLELATRVTMDVELGPYVGASEQGLARNIIERMGAGMLCLADRNFPGTELCRLVTDRESHFLWRVKSYFKLKPLEKLTDGSFLAHLADAVESPIIVRVIPYKLVGGKEKYRLVTSILDPADASAKELAELYHARWNVETYIAEMKTDLRASRILLRSKHPDTVYQELLSIVLGHYVVRSFMFEAAQKSGIPPDSLSFKHSVHVIRTSLSRIGDFSP
jgi:hypothetical protein